MSMTSCLAIPDGGVGDFGLIFTLGNNENYNCFKPHIFYPFKTT
jgi:hypothetical protein